MLPDSKYNTDRTIDSPQSTSFLNLYFSIENSLEDLLKTIVKEVKGDYQSSMAKIQNNPSFMAILDQIAVCSHSFFANNQSK